MQNSVKGGIKQTGCLHKNTEAFIVAHKELGVAVNAEKFKFMLMSQDQPAVQNHNIKIGSKPFERMG
jgi:hypothetical protein